MFYAPQLFSAFGNSHSWTLRSTLIIGAVNVASTVVAIVAVDRAGRKCVPRFASPTSYIFWNSRTRFYRLLLFPSF